ncbi:hypothetical protein [Dyadobacter soli]|nr:hypothetical protein [Dyadobacter soli]
MLHSNRDLMHLCLSLLEKLRDDKLRAVLIEEVIRILVKPIEGQMSVDAYSRYLFYKVLGEMYHAGMKAGHAAIGLNVKLPVSPGAVSQSMTALKHTKLNVEQKFALETAPFIKALRQTGQNTVSEIADKLNELDRPSPNGTKWNAQLVERIEILTNKIELT